MPFETERTSLESGVQVLALSGTMTMGNQLQKFEWLVEELSKGPEKRIVVDMSKITYLDSSAIGVLVGSHGLVRNAGGQFRLAGLSDRVVAIFKMTGLEGVLQSSPTRDEAVSAVGLTT
jgi:anti-sigma B factor antagonist